MLFQLRRYTVREGAWEEFVALFEDHIVPARQALGFEIAGVWGDESDGTFVWIVGHEAPEGWEAVDAAYYASPERAAVPRDPRELLDAVDTKVLRSLR